MLPGRHPQQCHLVNLWNARQLRCKTGDGNKHNGCSNGANTVDGGRRGGRKDAGGFSAQTELGEEVWPIWCWPGGLIMV